MEVDHLVADVDLHQMGVLVDLEAERPIEGDHGFGVLHREGDVVEAGDSSLTLNTAGLIRRHGRSRTAWRS